MNYGIVNLSELTKEIKTLKPKFHLNYGKYKLLQFKKRGGKTVVLKNIVQDVYRPGIFKRIFVESVENSYPYITASIMTMSNPLNNAKLISKKHTPWVNEMMLNPNQIFISCAGSIGNTRLITKDLEGAIGSQDIIRVIPFEKDYGFVYAYLSSPTCYNYLQSLIYGSVVPRLDPNTLSQIPIPLFPETFQEEIHQKIQEASILRVEANQALKEAEEMLFEESGLPKLSSDDYDFFGNHKADRKKATYIIKSKEISSITINAFNYSERIRKMIDNIKSKCKTVELNEILNEQKIFSTGAFPRIELDSDKAIILINQSDIFDNIIKGKKISRIKVKTDNLVKYGEVLIAGVGTLGENETFCRVVFANEDLEGKLVSGEFLRLFPTKDLSGYLFTWLSSKYGFRLIRSTQSGTKLCRPIPKLLNKIPVPILEISIMQNIDKMVKEAHTKRYHANQLENEAIESIEREIAQW